MVSLPPYDWSAGKCQVDGVLPLMRKNCDKRAFCFAYAHTENDPCPQVSKYLRITYSCEQMGAEFVVPPFLHYPQSPTHWNFVFLSTWFSPLKLK